MPLVGRCNSNVLFRFLLRGRIHLGLLEQETRLLHKGNSTWKPAIMQDYGGNVTWKAK
jgi:hypothetical protein